MTPELTVVIPTHNPDVSRLRRTLGGLRAQNLAADRWETVLIDNASPEPINADMLSDSAQKNLRVACEPQLGLTAARRRGLTEARAPLMVLVDDDNVLAPDYLSRVIRLFAEHPRLGAAGGKSLPEFETMPEPWTKEFFPLLALRDPGESPAIATTLTPPGAMRREYPADAAPIGAGMALRREAVAAWLDASSLMPISDRRGAELTSGGDNDIVFTLLEHGWHVGYFPELSLTHLIPSARLAPDYLARLNRGIQKSWMQVLTRHHANPWPPIASWSVPLRQLKAWFACRGWSSRSAHIRWQGACGHFEGRVSQQ